MGASALFAWIVFLPLLGAVWAASLGLARRPVLAAWGACAALSLAGLLSLFGFAQVALEGAAYKIPLLEWVHVGALIADWQLRIDTLSALMLLVVNLVSALIHIYALGYMADDKRLARFFCYLAFFTFAMSALVTADNFLHLFFGWEGVGLASYLLIGFWSERDSANAAAIKAFLVNRVGDFGLLLGMALIYYATGTLGFDAVFAQAEELGQQRFVMFGQDWPLLTTICLLLFVGACGKSAQFILHTWLPDAMEGPTPVSALIHAATMVTAGVFLLARASALFEYAPLARDAVIALGALTALFAASVGLVQNDIKRVIAYSTCSQLGYMFVALGVGAYQVAMFHLFTHAFFKALLFLGAGSVIHGLGGEQDMRKMGGLWRSLPWSWGAMLLGTLALTGAPLFAGYYSKDAIIEASYMGASALAAPAALVLMAAALMTAFYAWRLMFLTFHGTSRLSAEDAAGVHESPLVMLLPMAGLALGAVLAGWATRDWFIGAAQASFWYDAIFTAADNQILLRLTEAPLWVVLAPLAMGAAGLLLAALHYLVWPDLPAIWVRWTRPLHLFLLRKWYVDELYEYALVRPLQWLAQKFWRIGDVRVIDGLGPHGLAAVVLVAMQLFVRLQSGYLYHYAFAMLLGVSALVSWLALGGS